MHHSCESIDHLPCHIIFIDLQLYIIFSQENHILFIQENEITSI
jgi:hypothetical protein